MAETHRERTALLALMPVGVAEGSSAQDIRDGFHSTVLRNVTTYTTTTPTIDDDDFIVELDGTSNTVTALLATPTSSFPIRIVIAINIANAVALDPGANNLDGATDDYVFATVNDVKAVYWNGSSWRTLWNHLNA